MTIISYEDTTPQRIDVFLTSQFPYSRNFFHHIIQRGGIHVGGKTIKKSYKLKQHDQIQIDSLERFLGPGILDECAFVDIPIVHETDDYCVLHKPKGVVSHPNSIWDVNTPSVVAFLHHHYKSTLPTVGSFIRAGLIHRLDKDTDGLMIIAKSERGLAHFKELFQAKSTSKTIQEKEQIPLKKIYRASCIITEKGNKFLTQVKDQLPFYIQEMVYAKVPHYIPKMGITKIRKIEYPSPQKATLELEILTGRTHQIRYHLSQHGLPIVGDYLYGKESDTAMQLSAMQLRFVDPDKQEIVLTTPLED